MAEENRVIIRVTSENDTRAGFDAAKADAAIAGDEAGQSFHRSFAARLSESLFGGVFGGGGGGAAGGAGAAAAGGGGGLAALGPYGIGAGIAAGALAAPAAAGGIATLGLGAIGIKDAFAQNAAAATAFSDALKPISEIAGKAFQPVIGFLTEMAKQLAGPVGQMIAAAEPGMLAFFKNLEPYLARIVPELGQFVRSFAPFAGELGTTLGVALQAIVRGLQNLEPAFSTSARFIHGFVGVAAGLFDGLTRLVGDLVAIIGDIFRGKWGDIWTKAKDMLHYSLDGLATLLTNFFDWAITTWVPKMLSGIGGEFGKLGDMLYNAGKNAILGLWHGAESVMGGFLHTAESWGHDIANAIGSAFGIHFSEPSEASLMVKAGEMIPRGLAKGILSGHPALAGAMSGLGTGGGAVGAGGGGVQVVFSGAGAMQLQQFIRMMWPEMRMEVLRTGGGGPHAVQNALGQVRG